MSELDCKKLLIWLKKKLSKVKPKYREQIYDGFMDRAIKSLPKTLAIPSFRDIHWRQAEIDAFRKVARSKVTYKGDMPDILTEYRDTLEQDEEVSWYKTYENRLSDQEKKVIHLVYFENKSISYISKELKIHASSVRAIRARALKRLSEIPKLKQLVK